MEGFFTEFGHVFVFGAGFLKGEDGCVCFHFVFGVGL